MDLKVLTKKANRGSKEHQFLLGMRFLKGIDCMEDKLTAEKWFKKAAKKNHNEALYHMGHLKIEQEEYKLAFTYFKKSAKHKFFSAYKMLGYLYKGDYDLELQDYKKSQEAFYKYYLFDKFDGLDPLLSVYDATMFKSSKVSYQFLKEAMEFGLIKAKFHLAMLFLTDKKYLDYDKALKFMEDYYTATADVNAARELYYLYSPKEDVYPGFKKKDKDKARMYLKETIEGDGILKGTEFIYSHGIYYPQNVMPLSKYLDKTITRMKTSLAIDQNFSQIVSLNTFDIVIHYNVEIVYDYDAKINYKKRIIEEELYEKEIEKKQTVRKGLKKTGTVKIPTIVKKTKKHKKWVEEETTFEETGNIERIQASHVKVDSLKNLAYALESQDHVFNINQPITHKALLKQVDKDLKKKFKKPKKSKKFKHQFNLDYIYILQPVMQVNYRYQSKIYQDMIDLSEKDKLRQVKFPLERSFARELKRFKRRQASLERNNWILSILWFAGFSATFFMIYPTLFEQNPVFNFMYTYFIYQILSLGIAFGIGYLIHRIVKVYPVSEEDYIRHYDDATADELRTDIMKNNWKIWLKLSVVVILVAINIYLYYFS